MPQWIALGLALVLLCVAILLCCRRPSPRHQFVFDAVEHLAQRAPAEMELRDAQVTGSSSARRTA